ncbi:MAG: helix-turn-helix domain-containing protein [Defluviitaleaceae bacterium]|nr:helix-turn-helix domain-containing protein [Defluviitaleaceae bacterium]
MDYLRVFGENVRLRRLHLGLTQEQLSERADLHRTYIGAIERGDRNVSLKNIVVIGQALNIKPYELLLFPDEKK